MNRGLQLALEVGSVKTEPMERAAIEALSEVQVQSAATGQSGFQLKFTIGKHSSLSRVLVPSGYLDPQRRVIITAILRGTPQVLMDGVITKQDLAPSDDAGASTLTITGMDLTVHMDFVDLSGVLSYPALPQNLIVMAILAKYAGFGVIPAVVPPLIPVIANPLERFIAHQGTDLAFINMLAKKTGYVFYLDPGPTPGKSMAYWGPEIRYGDSQPVLSIDLDAASNVDSLSFSYDGLSRQQIMATIQLPVTPHFGIPIPIPEITLLKPRLAAKPAVVMKTRNIQVARFNAAEAIQLGLAALAGPSDAVTASGQLDVLRYGQVLMPRKIVTVRGGGHQFNGRYFVKNVTHTIRSGAYNQSFSLARGGTQSDV